MKLDKALELFLSEYPNPATVRAYRGVLQPMVESIGRGRSCVPGSNPGAPTFHTRINAAYGIQLIRLKVSSPYPCSVVNVQKVSPYPNSQNGRVGGRRLIPCRLLFL